MTVASPWQWFCATRTFSNSLETTLTVAALAAWPWHWALEPLTVHDRTPNTVREEPVPEDGEDEVEAISGSAVKYWYLSHCKLGGH